MDINQQKEQFSNAYLTALATVAGFSLSKSQVDDKSVDWEIEGYGLQGKLRNPKFGIQLKCTHLKTSDGKVLKYPLKAKNYNDLRQEDYMVPCFLVVVQVPDDVDDWLVEEPEQLVLKHTAYWLSLMGLPETNNKKTIQIKIPLSHRLTVQQLKWMMEQVGEGENIWHPSAK